MNYTEYILVKDYFKVHDFYSNVYGDGKTIVAIRVGSFYEIYNTPENGLRHLENLAQELDVVSTAKNGSNTVSEKNWRMIGFPSHTIDNFIEKLVDLNYTVVVVDQIPLKGDMKISKKNYISKDKKGDEFYRKVTRIESPSTFLKINKVLKVWEASSLVSLYFDIDSRSNKLLIVGMSSYDLFTGKGFFYESYSRKNDVNFALDDTIRFIETFPPKEILVDFNFDENEKVSNLNQNEILSYLKINRDSIIKSNVKKNSYNKIQIQKNILDECNFSFNNQLSIIENLDLQNYNWSRVALVGLLDFIKNHQENLLRKLEIPLFFHNKDNLYLGNRALDQLNVLPSQNSINKSLFEIINFNKSVLGKRFLKDQLVNPLYDFDELKNRYELIECFKNNKIDQHIGIYLESIYDIDKIVRKSEINIVDPCEIWKLYYSISNFKSIYDEICKFKSSVKVIDNFTKNMVDKNPIDKISVEISELFEKTFNLEILSNKKFTSTYVEDDETFFKSGYSKELDDIRNEIFTCNNFLDNLIKGISSLIEEKNYMNKETKLCDVKFNERDGHYLILTKRRHKMMLNKIKSLNKDSIRVGSIDVKLSEFDFQDLPKSSNVKVKCEKLNNLSGQLVKLKFDLVKKTKDLFFSFVSELMNKYDINIKKISYNLAYIDFINSGSICSIKNHYSKPSIIISDKSYFIAKGMRHPIVEFINEDFKYSPHDISLGKDLNGMLIYGINSSGKSTLMKSIGLNILMAQIGYFVSASNFEFSPYKNIFTRIVGNDDLYRGLSSFMVEMVELMNILKRKDKNTLVLADEICKGTEEKSANILVAYMLEVLDKSESSFLTASHLHKLSTMESVKNLKSVKPFHLKVSYDEENKSIIYDRELIEGTGENFYGLQVAKYLMNDISFNDRTKELTKEFEGIDSQSDSGHSIYNSKLELKKCVICNSDKKLETHHIHMQKFFNEKSKSKGQRSCVLIDDKNPEIFKNKLYNLVVLCSSCHDKVDSGLIKINGFKSTSKGIKLDFEISKKKDIKLKLNGDQINIIKKVGKDKALKNIKIELLEKHNLKVSVNTISKVLKGDYEPKNHT